MSMSWNRIKRSHSKHRKHILRAKRGLAVVGLFALVGMTGCGAQHTGTPVNSAAHSANLTSSAPLTAAGNSASTAAPVPSGSSLSSAPLLCSLVNVSGFYPQAVDIIDADHAMLGGKGMIYRTEDGGHTWQRVWSGSQNILQLDFFDSQTGWALTSTGIDSMGEPTGIELWETDDGGQHWRVMAEQSALNIGTLKPGQQIRIGFRSKDLGFVYVTGTGGPNDAETSTGFASVTTNGGLNWRAVNLPSGTVSTAFADVNTGYVLVNDHGKFQVDRTTDGGQHWNPVMQRTSQQGVTGEVHTYGPNQVWVRVNGGYGMMQESYSLFYSGDAGAHWRTVIAQATAGGGPAPGVSGQGTRGPGTVPDMLDVVGPGQAFFSGSCLACGPNGVVSVASITGNGSHVSMLRDTLPGTDSWVLFTSRTDGWVVTAYHDQDGSDRTDVYRSSDGGQSWVLYARFGKGMTPAKTDTMGYDPAKQDAAKATASQSGISLYLPETGLAGDALDIVKSNGDGSIGLVFHKIWIMESNSPLPNPEHVEVRYEQPVTGDANATYLMGENTAGPTQFLYLKRGDTYITLQFLQSAQGQDGRVLAVIANSLQPVQ